MGVLKFVSRALLSLVMDKDARAKLERRREAGKETARGARINALRQAAGHVMTPEREQLIRNAMNVHRAKSRIIEDLKDEEKQRLYALAVKKLLRGNDGDGDT